MTETLRSWFFPERMRLLPQSRAMSIAMRTLHMGAFGVLLGGHTFALDADRLIPYLWVTIVSGLGLIALEVYAVGLYWLVLGKGIMVLVKLVLLLLIPFFWEARVPLLLLVVSIASIGSHMPARYRHYSILHRQVIEPGVSLQLAVASVPAETAAVPRTDDGRQDRG
jgi:hypothetical protein